MSATEPRAATITRTTFETEITCTVTLDPVARNEVNVATGLGFLDHMLASFARHSGIELTLRCRGDLHIDDHHTVEDCAIVLGTAFDRALGDRTGIARFGWAMAPLDEALSRAVVDLVTRPCASIDLGLKRERIGDVASENLTHFFRSFATSARLTLHIDVLKGDNDHHRAESAFKSLALATRQATARTGESAARSTKGSL